MANVNKNKRVSPLKKVEGDNKKQPIGFDKIAVDMKNRVTKLATKKGISSFTMLGVGVKNGEPKYSGGMVGDARLIVEGLYYMAKQRKDVRQVIEIVANALKSNELQEYSKIEDLVKGGKMSVMAANALADKDITDLKQLKKKTRKEIANIKNIGNKSMAEIDELMKERSWDYLTEKKIR